MDEVALKVAVANALYEACEVGEDGAVLFRGTYVGGAARHGRWYAFDFVGADLGGAGLETREDAVWTVVMDGVCTLFPPHRYSVEGTAVQTPLSAEEVEAAASRLAGRPVQVQPL